jgi:uncharacterized RDD family membrane protein YckC
MLLDSLLIALLIYPIAFLPPMETWSAIKPTLFILGVLVLDPVLVSLTGGTIGHHWKKIRVTHAHGGGRIGLFRSIIRFILKVSLGWFSLVVVMTTRRHQALHDLATGSLVVYDNADHLPEHEKLSDRSDLNEQFNMPSGKRRVMVISAYFILEYILFMVIVLFCISRYCLTTRICSAMDTIILETSNVVWLIAVSLTIIFGWQGQIFGCRRKSKELTIPAQSDAPN